MRTLPRERGNQDGRYRSGLKNRTTVANSFHAVAPICEARIRRRNLNGTSARAPGERAGEYTVDMQPSPRGFGEGWAGMA